METATNSTNGPEQSVCRKAAHMNTIYFKGVVSVFFVSHKHKK